MTHTTEIEAGDRVTVTRFAGSPLAWNDDGVVTDVIGSRVWYVSDGIGKELRVTIGETIKIHRVTERGDVS